MKIALYFAALMTAFAAQGATAQTPPLKDLTPHYTPHEQTANERLQNFRPPPPPPPQQSPLDRAVNTYNNLPVKPDYDASKKAPMIKYQKKF